jgi:hypothetical protein
VGATDAGLPLLQQELQHVQDLNNACNALGLTCGGPRRQ